MIDRANVHRYRDDLARDLTELIQIPSVRGDAATDAPFGVETANALKYVLRRGEELGFQVKNLNGYAGHVEYGTTGPLYAVLCHVDVVPAGDGWRHDPFGGDLEDGYIYGRGASDNKGPAIAALYVLRAFADAVPEPKARIRLIFGTNEESGMGGMRHYFSHEPLPEFGFSPDSGYPLYNREMGIVNVLLSAPRSDKRIIENGSGGNALNMVADEAHAQITSEYEQQLMDIVTAIGTEGSIEHRIEVVREPGRLLLSAKGISAHGGRPANGVSAISYLVNALCELIMNVQNDIDSEAQTGIEPEVIHLFHLLGFETRGDSLGIACRDDISGELSVNWGTLNISDEQITAGLNIRYPVTASYEKIQTALTKRVARYGFKAKFDHHLEPLFLPEDNRFIQILLNAYSTVSGEKAAPLSMSGGTYARMLQNRGVAFGAAFPGEMNNVHQPDERISLDSLMRHAEICLQAIYDLATS